VADFLEGATDAPGNRGRNNFQNRRQGREAYGASESNMFGYVHDEDEKSFSLVEGVARGATKPKASNIMRGIRGRGFGGNRGRGGFGRGQAPRGGFAARGRGGGRGGYRGYDQVCFGLVSLPYGVLN
jgi:translation initiation factor 3 subunit D